MLLPDLDAGGKKAIILEEHPIIIAHFDFFSLDWQYDTTIYK